jgi:hypothetical protein
LPYTVDDDAAVTPTPPSSRVAATSRESENATLGMMDANTLLPLDTKSSLTE